MGETSPLVPDLTGIPEDDTAEPDDAHVDHHGIPADEEADE